METVKQWAMGITVSAVIGTVILVVTPKGSTEKTVRTAVALFLLCAITTPFMTGVDFSGIFSGIKKPEPIVTDKIESQIAEQTEIAVKEKIDEILLENGINSAEINIDISMNKDKELTVDMVEIFADKNFSNSFENAQKKIKSETGIDVKIEVKK